MAEFDRVFKPDQHKTSRAGRPAPRPQEEDDYDPLAAYLLAPGADMEAILSQLARHNILRYADALYLVANARGRDAAVDLHRRVAGPRATGDEATEERPEYSDIDKNQAQGTSVTIRRPDGVAEDSPSSGLRITQRPLDQIHPSVRRLVELTTGRSLGQVEVQLDDAEVASQGHQAQAEGDLIRLAPSVDPTTDQGLRVLAHEAAHVLQQRRSPDLSRAHNAADAIRRAETEAVEVAEAALTGRRRAIEEAAPAGLGFTEVVQEVQSLWQTTEAALTAPQRGPHPRRPPAQRHRPRRRRPRRRPQRGGRARGRRPRAGARGRRA